MEVFNLDLRPGRANPVLHCSQFDEGRAFRAMLFDGAAVYTLDGTETITLIEKKLDGNEVTIAVTNTSDNYVDFSTTQQMTALEGSQLCELRIEKGGDLIGSLNFILECEASPDTGIASDSAIHNLEQQIYDAVADQYDSNNVIFDNAPTAGHGVGYVVTSEGTPDELEDLTDVTLTTPTSGEALVWDGSKWTNGTVSTVGSIDDLNDVDTTGKAEGDSLRYNSTAQEWEARPVVYEMTLAEYTALGGDYTGYEDSLIVLTDAPNLNATANDLSMGSAPYASGSTAEAIGAKVDNSVSMVYINAVTNVSQTLGSYSRKMGKLVCLCHNFKITGTATSGTTIATLQSSANYPSSNVTAFCLFGSAGSTWLVNIDTSGNIKSSNNMPMGEYILIGYYATA